MTLYRAGLERWYDWTASGVPHQWLLLDTNYTINHEDDIYVADIVDHELPNDSGYHREPARNELVAPVTEWNIGQAYGVDNPSFTGLTGETLIGWLVLTYNLASDADSGLIAYWSFPPIEASVGRIDFTLPAWSDTAGGSLPGGSAATGLVHLREMW